ncbi:MAG: DUF5717 family protein [Muribaculum sp.]|nr:DUF5717 family protein [Muribaculum sp.]
MRDMLKQITERKLEYENGSLDFSCAKVELFLQAGECCEGSFDIMTHGAHAIGRVSSSDIRMECLTTELAGMDEEIAFRFHGEHVQAGEVIRGYFYVVSNLGEYSLPFTATASEGVLQSSVGPVKNLFHYVNLARDSWEEAVELFYSPDFVNILAGNDSQYYTLYMGLSSDEGNAHNVDQFLTAIHKKQPLEYQLMETGLDLEEPAGMTELEVNLTRSGWGHTCLRVNVQGEFLFTEKQTITGEDFVGGICRLPVFIDGSMLHGGKNLGCITLFDTEHTLTAPVTVRCGRGGAALARAARERKRIMAQLMEHYQALRLKQISTAIWLRESDKLVDALVTMDEQDVAARLFQARLMITDQRDHEAGWLLDHAGELLEQGQGLHGAEPEALEAYYLYLTMLLKQDEEYTAQVAERVRSIYYEHPGQWRVAWLYMKLSEDFQRNPSAKWSFLAKLSGYGCCSPVIYIEALKLLNRNPAMLRRLGDFELQVLVYGNKRNVLSPELLEQMYYLAERTKEYSPRLYVLLRSCYERLPQERILKEICRLLIKGNKVTAEAFAWYKRGVEEELRITKLYEYFMMALDPDGEICLPKQVLLYFSYQNNLDYARSACMYRYLLEHKEEYIDLYADYHQQIQEFAVEQIRKGRVNRDLAVLYRELLTDDRIDEEVARQLGHMIFTHEIRLANSGIRNVVIYQPGNRMETIYPVVGERACFALYGSDCLVLLEDGSGCRYLQGIPYTLDKLMIPGRYIRQVAGWVKNNPELDLYLYRSRELPEETDMEALWQRVWQHEGLELSVRREACLRLMQHYYQTEQKQRLYDFLMKLPAELLGRQEQQEAVRYMVICGNYEQAYRWLCDYMLYGLDGKAMVCLAGQMIQNCEYARDEQLLKLSELIFQEKKYDSTILRYLCLHYQGPSRDMRNIWKAARSYDVDCHELSERLLLQMLLTGVYVGEQDEIFASYVSEGADPEVEAAYLSQSAYDYFVRDKKAQPEIFQEIMRLRQSGEPIRKVCRLAFVKYYAERPQERTEEIYQTAADFIRQLMDEGIHLEAFLSYKGLEKELAPIMDRTFIEYHGHPDSVVRIHYLLTQENSGEDLYITEEMLPICGGVCSKEFVLFFGETLQYYIMEERGRVEQLMESGKLCRGDASALEHEGRFERINEMVTSRVLEDYDSLDRQLEEFYRTEYFNREFFQLR